MFISGAQMVRIDMSPVLSLCLHSESLDLIHFIEHGLAALYLAIVPAWSPAPLGSVKRIFSSSNHCDSSLLGTGGPLLTSVVSLTFKWGWLPAFKASLKPHLAPRSFPRLIQTHQTTSLLWIPHSPELLGIILQMWPQQHGQQASSFHRPVKNPCLCSLSALILVN